MLASDRQFALSDCLGVPVRASNAAGIPNCAPELPPLSTIRTVTMNRDCICADGGTCELHPDMPWPHNDCSGPGELCPNPDCLAGRILRAELDAKRAEPNEPN